MTTPQEIRNLFQDFKEGKAELGDIEAVLLDYADLLEEIHKDFEEDMPVEEPVLNEDGSLHQYTLKFSGRPYRCECGCNVFHKPDKLQPDVYQCNGCPHRFETAPE